LILASTSPRRRDLLVAAGYEIRIEPSHVDEPKPPLGTPVVPYVADLAFRKAIAVAERLGTGLILAADTACAVEGEILNKPVDRRDAERMIRLQEGRDTEVVTGLCIMRAEWREWVAAVESSFVHIRPLTDVERNAHLDDEVRWSGKAGAYGVQDSDPYVTVTRGSWSNVVGLPMERLEALLLAYPRLTHGL
jgi:septum formation protein